MKYAKTRDKMKLKVSTKLIAMLLMGVFLIGALAGSGIQTVNCFSGDVTDPDLKIQHIRNAKQIKDFILRQSEEERMKRKTLHTQSLDGGPMIGEMGRQDSCR